MSQESDLLKVLGKWFPDGWVELKPPVRNTESAPSCEPSYTVTVVDMTTGEGREALAEWRTGTWREDTYFWTLGNAGCDCNRSLRFNEVNSGKVEWENMADCDEARYGIEVRDLDGGILYTDVVERATALEKLLSEDNGDE